MIVKPKQKLNIIEFGCGNGRDAKHFHGFGHFVTVTDQCITDELKQLANHDVRFQFLQGAVSKTSDSVFTLVDEMQTDLPPLIYSRFFQHTIDAQAETEMLQNISANICPGVLAFFELRLHQDELLQKTFGDHYRRFQSGAEFEAKLTLHGFHVLYRCEGVGYAKFGDEDPFVGRFIAVKRPTFQY